MSTIKHLRADTGGRHPSPNQAGPRRGDGDATEAAANLVGDLLHRHQANPLLRAEHLEGAHAIYNAGACKVGDEYILLATVLSNAPVPVLWVARSSDGVSFRFDPRPLIRAEPDELWLCDPRISRIDGQHYITMWTGTRHGVRTAIGRVDEGFGRFERMHFICEPDNRNIVLFPEKIGGRYARLDRPYGQIARGEIWISFSPDLRHWGDSQLLLASGPMFQWQGEKIGPGAPPVKTRHGWLEIYHGVRHGFFAYHLGALLLDLNDPTKVLGACPNPILVPRSTYERVGNVNNVVFSGGVILEPDGELKVYYGGADQCVCLATAHVDDVAAACLQNHAP